MTQPRPTATELIDAVRTFLDDELLPTLDGRQRFHTRVAVNVLDIVIRELADGGAADTAEAERLRGLLDEDGDVDNLSRLLATRIRAGEIDITSADLLEHLRATSTADVSIANPRHG